MFGTLKRFPLHRKKFNCFLKCIFIESYLTQLCRGEKWINLSSQDKLLLWTFIGSVSPLATRKWKKTLLLSWLLKGIAWNLWCPKSMSSNDRIKKKMHIKKCCFELHVLGLLFFMFNLAVIYLENALNWDVSKRTNWTSS